MKTWTPSAILLAASVMSVTACVTVNVSFPESTVQRATDDYVQELYRAKANRGKTPAAEPSKSPTSFVDFLIPSAHAVEVSAQFRTDTATAREIQGRQASRLDEIDAQKKAGVLGETADGMLVIKSPEKLKKLLATKIEKLVKDENADREKLYQEVQEANNLAASRLKDVGASFARSFQKASPAGTWIQSEDGKWSRK